MSIESAASAVASGLDTFDHKAYGHLATCTVLSAGAQVPLVFSLATPGKTAASH
jgi:hypothetical protein